MNKNLLTAAVLGISMAACASDGKEKNNMAGGETATVECHGVTSCKGTGDCGGDGHACAGKNACKGHGWKKMSEHDCTVAKEAMAAAAKAAVPAKKAAVKAKKAVK